MTNNQIAPEAVPAPQPYAVQPARPASPEKRVRAQLARVTVGVGAYLTFLAFSGQIYSVFIGMMIPAGVVAFMIVQVLIALGLIVLGFSFAPTSAVRRLLAIGLTVGFVILAFVLAVTRLKGSPFGSAGIPISLTVGNVTFMLVVAVTVGWLIVRERNPLALLFVVVAGVIPLAQWNMMLGGIESGITQLVLMFIGILVFVGVAWLGRAVSGPDKH
ncbi:hypothetical protein EYE40_13145 [Glaciihabitans arcticus]|uniref:Uncharacterized protein n=1 Tax=Glaciihabitans arcticus TaxID=2668039 RepID=A0A4Q9GVJ5_9MICO|nr:hypothetical protein [Glaciihabitans arcticus]TBN58264.1 hypothetical protein EYE40_13145 [Glaciihabitans arcticus]